MPLAVVFEAQGHPALLLVRCLQVQRVQCCPWLRHLRVRQHGCVYISMNICVSARMCDCGSIRVGCCLQVQRVRWCLWLGHLRVFSQHGHACQRDCMYISV